MEEYAKAKAKQMVDNARFIEAITILGVEATYFAGMYTVKIDGKFLGKMDAADWLDYFKDALEKVKAEKA